MDKLTMFFMGQAIYFTAMKNRFGECTSRQYWESWFHDYHATERNWEGRWLYTPFKELNHNG